MAEQIKNTLTSYMHLAADKLYAKARDARNSAWGNKIFIYGFLYLSTFCKNNCAFCQYRSSNGQEERYRKNLQELLEAGKRLADDGVHLLDLTLGEDLYYTSEENFSRLEEIVSELHRQLGLPIMVSPGVITKGQLQKLQKAGANWYACYQETHDRSLFAKLRLNQDFTVRKQARLDAKDAGLLVEDGLLTGVGEDNDILLYSIEEMYREPLAQVRAMSYVPHECTFPSTAGDTLEERREHELKAIALMRLLMPQRLIPASLDVDGLEGLAMRLNAGANVVTSIVPSGRGFAGVASKELDIDNNNRSVFAVRKKVEELGLQIAAQSDYAAWIKEQNTL